MRPRNSKTQCQQSGRCDRHWPRPDLLPWEPQPRATSPSSLSPLICLVCLVCDRVRHSVPATPPSVRDENNALSRDAGGRLTCVAPCFPSVCAVSPEPQTDRLQQADPAASVLARLYSSRLFIASSAYPPYFNTLSPFFSLFSSKNGFCCPTDRGLTSSLAFPVNLRHSA